ncbi:MAG: hypothetical protein V4739_14805 [Pseudomonadota bacterium]
MTFTVAWRGRVIRAGLAAWLVGLAGWAGPAGAAPTEGERLYTGAIPLPGRIWGHERDLPQEASRCTNCHVRSARPAAASAPATVVGPLLSADALGSLRSRRGGPPTRFDAVSLCRLLRHGIDPAEIVVPRVMPRYTVSDAQCRALWQHLASPAP